MPSSRTSHECLCHQPAPLWGGQFCPQPPFRRLTLSPLCWFFLAFCLLISASAQTAEQLEAPAVNRVAEKLLCSCGCNLNMACRMEPYPCRVCWENKKKILKMQTAGLSDQAILDQFAQANGKGIVSVQPGILGSLSFYSAAAIGLILVVLAIRRYRRGPAAIEGVALDERALDRYHDQIEKEVEKLD